ncbi:hypothetical protein F994_00796 [Acinetobacter bohemicus ANC 3994]|uniref:Uncharacterized protein n=1 Tax=Acinetobacter bohemicus ANC 3994 TaxID=1217715 RepID=N8P2G1_9GAMM|nr:hypothetical protein [Acinetobacter bohemicus]ENU20570.1 hypothetical protein F994_00796 [Acinetobacter bohemicus ANC 3994]
MTPAEKIQTELSNYRYYKNKFGEAHPRTMDKLLEIADLIPREWTADKDTALSKFVASARLISDLRKKDQSNNENEVTEIRADVLQSL